MGNIEIRDGDVAEKFLKATGTGTDVDPFIPEHKETSAAAMLTSLQLLDDVVATDGATAPTKGIMLSGYDGTNAQLISTDSSGFVAIRGSATTGSAQGATVVQVAGGDGTNTRLLKTNSSGEAQVGVVTLPALPAGTNNIGDVDVLSLPALPSGSNTIGKVDQGAAGASAWPVKTEVQTDFDTSGTTQNISLIGVALPASGGAVVGGTATNPFNITGTVTGNQGTAAAGSGAWPVTVTDTSNTVVKPGDSANNAIRVNIVAGAGSGGTAIADKAGFTEGTTNFTPAGGVFNETISADPTEDQGAAVRITAKRAFHTNLRASSGTELATATTTPGASDLGLVVRNIPSGTQTVSGTVTANAGSGTMSVGGPAAHDAAVSGFPIQNGAYASAAAPTDVSADGDMVRLWALRNGSQVVNIAAGGALIGGDATNGLKVDITRIAAGTNAIGKLAANDGVDIGDVTINNAAGSAVNTILRDGAGDSVMDDTNNAVRVNIVAGAGSGGTAITDDAAFTVGTTSLTPVGGTYKSVRDSVDDNDAGAFAMTAKRALYTVIETPNGDSAMDETNDAIRVNIVAGSGSGTEYTEDAAAAADPSGPMMMAVRRDTLSGTEVSADGDNIALKATAKGELYVKQTDAIAATQSGTWNVGLNAGTNAIGKLAANDGVDIGDVTLNNATIAVTKSGTWDITNAGTFAVQDSQVITDNAAFTDGTTKLFIAGYIYDETAGTALTENDAAAARINVNRATVSTLEDGATRGRYATVTAANALKVDNSGVTQPVSGTITANAGSGTFAVSLAAGATAIAKAEDVASADADVGVPAMAVRKATPANTSGTDGDYEMLQMSAGRLWTSSTIDAALPAGTNAIGKLAANSGVDIGDVDVLSIVPGTAATNLGKAEDAAHTSGDTGVFALSVRKDTPTQLAGTDADYAPVITNADGAMWVAPAASINGGYTPGKLISAASTNATSVKASAATLGFITASNVNAAARFLKIYNKASAPTVGTDAPVQVYLIPGNTAGAGTNLPIPEQGLALGAGFAFALTTGVADSDTGAVAANEIVVNYGYK